MNYTVKDDSIIFFDDNFNEIGTIVYSVDYMDNIESMYFDSVDDFDPSSLRMYDPNKKIINIDDVWVDREHRGEGLFVDMLRDGLTELSTKSDQFILRAWSDNGFPEDKLAEIYSRFDFMVLQYTDNDGIIMGKTADRFGGKMNEDLLTGIMGGGLDNTLSPASHMVQGSYPGYVYSLRAFNDTLQQKTNKPSDSYYIHKGSLVRGVGFNNPDKTYKGYVNRIVRDGDGSVLFLYIQTLKNSRLVSIKADDNLELIIHKDDEQVGLRTQPASRNIDLQMTDGKAVSESNKYGRKIQVLNEISVADKYKLESEKGLTDLSFDDYEYICSLDPTTKPNKAGEYCNWLLNHIEPYTDLRDVKDAIVCFDKCKKKGLLKHYGIDNDINKFSDCRSFIDTMHVLYRDGVGELSDSELTNMNKLEGQFEVFDESDNWIIITPLTWEAERYFGRTTGWCTVANKIYFDEYTVEGKLYINYPKNGDLKLRSQFFFEQDEFASVDDNVVHNPKRCISEILGDSELYKELYDLWNEDERFSSYPEPIEFDGVQKLLDQGEPLYNIVDSYEEPIELPYWFSYQLVTYKGKMNYCINGKKILLDDWHDLCSRFDDQCYLALIGDFDKNETMWFTVITPEGKQLYDTWFVDINNGFAKDKQGRIYKRTGKFIFQEVENTEQDNVTESYIPKRRPKRHI